MRSLQDLCMRFVRSAFDERANFVGKFGHDFPPKGLIEDDSARRVKLHLECCNESATWRD